MIKHVLGPTGGRSSRGTRYTTICLESAMHEMMDLLPRLQKELEFQLDAANAKTVEWRLLPSVEFHNELGKARIRCRLAVTEQHKHEAG